MAKSTIRQKDTKVKISKKTSINEVLKNEDKLQQNVSDNIETSNRETKCNEKSQDVEQHALSD